ncbi:LysM domain protein, partial [Metarhizium majus ARSEF 297]
MSMIQTESPYFLPDPQAPEPFTNITRFAGDPSFKDCDTSNPHCAAAWGLSVISSTNVHVYRAGLYNWFQRYIQPCVDTQDCQQRVVNIEDSGQVWIYNLYTIGTVEMINHGDDKPVLAKANTNTNGHPFTSVVNAWLFASTGEGSREDDIWNQHDESGKDVSQCRKDTDVFWRNYPKLKDNFKLTDPSSVIKNAYDKTKALLAETEVQMTMADFHFASWSDTANTLVLPAMSLSAAVKNMEGIVRIANQKIEQERKEGIATIVTAVFFFIPFIGEGAGAIGLATLRTIIDLTGSFADIGYGIYDTLQDPKNALSNILGIIFARGSLKGVFRAASAEWRTLKQDKIENLPQTFLKDNTVMRKMQASCKL